MNWDAIGAIGEIMGGLVVIATLVYLARQTRSAQQATADANRLNRANGVTAMALAGVQDSDMVDAIAEAHGLDPYYEAFAQEFGISLSSAKRADWYHIYYFWLHWGQFASSTTDSDQSELQNIISSWYAIPVVRYSWDHSRFAKPILDPPFIAFVDDVLSNQAPHA